MYSLFALVVGSIGVIIGRFLVIPRISPRPDNLGVTDGKLRTCSDRRNCVNSQDGSGYAVMESIPFSGDLDETRSRMVRVINEMDRSEIVKQTHDYIHAEFRSLMWGFIDDVELYFDEADQVVHFRSASRIGRGDMGVNRDRMSDLRERFLSASGSTEGQSSGTP
jgi:uncharacterized protein (DUF1499 family)